MIGVSRVEMSVGEGSASMMNTTKVEKAAVGDKACCTLAGSDDGES